MTSDTTRSRLLEVAVSVIFSIIAASLTVSWALSATLENFRVTQAEQDKRIQQNSDDVRQTISTNAQQNTQLGITQVQYNDIVRRLEQIEKKIDTRNGR